MNIDLREVKYVVALSLQISLYKIQHLWIRSQASDEGCPLASSLGNCSVQLRHDFGAWSLLRCDGR
jgi:hypothetical protein